MCTYKMMRKKKEFNILFEREKIGGCINWREQLFYSY